MSRLATAAYCRESKSGPHDENALRRQSEMVRRFIDSRADLVFKSEYTDLGHTGRTFERPGWKKLISDIDDIQCIVVYDLSRLGRNYIDCSDVIEILMLLNVRLLTVRENIDTEHWTLGEAMETDLYNFFNAEYLRDVSTKTHASLDNLRKQGRLLPAILPYGYKKVDGKMYVDDEKAPVVKRIFDEYILGHGFTEIARGLENDGIPKPGNARVWYPATVRAILANRMYTGEYVSGKERVNLHQRTDMPEDAWITIKNHHDAIVSEVVFDAAQERLIPRDYVRRVPEPEDFGELNGIAFCGHCGRTLLNKAGKYYCKKCRISVDEWYIHQSLLQTALQYQKALPHPEKMDRTKLKAVFRKDLIVAEAKREEERTDRVFDDLFERNMRGEITDLEFKVLHLEPANAWLEAKAEWERQKEERNLLEKHMHECITFVRKARLVKFTEILNYGENPENLELVQKLIEKATLTQDADGKRINVTVKMADRIKEDYDWWEKFEPETILAE